MCGKNICGKNYDKERVKCGIYLIYDTASMRYFFLIRLLAAFLYFSKLKFFLIEIKYRNNKSKE